MDSNWHSSEYFNDNERTELVHLLETITSQLKLMKHLKDDSSSVTGTISEKEYRTIDFTLKCLLTVTEEIRTRGTFDLLEEIISKERSNCDQIRSMKKQIKTSERRCEYLNKCIKEDGQRSLNEFQFKDRIISEQTIELERLKQQNDEELEFNEELLRVQMEENELKCVLEEKKLEEEIIRIDDGFKLEEKVHEEVLFYYDNEIKRVNELIAYWKDRNKDIEERKLLLKSLLDSQREQHEELQFYVSLFKSRESEIQEYLDDKDRRRKEKEYEIYLNTMATKIQSWWRGVMVRRCLGPFKHLLKIKNAKKRKMSLKKVTRK
ncbi:dynein regulatory complex protein 9 [Planococcus citri]|uniref:dynein regulatory complex protein 9 n=1 Tax=Planococcus citri TaxID=170843 RepID=UPI0031F76E6C